MNDKVEDRSIFYKMVYGLAFVLALISGSAFGFTGGHTPPIPFVIEIFVVPFGFFIVLINYARNKPVKVHLWGLLANVAILTFVICLALSNS